MRINKLTIKNFKGFENKTFEFPQTGPGLGNGSFHLIIGQNGKGKTSALDALAVAAGSWLLGVPGFSPRPLGEQDVRQVVLEFEDTARIEKLLPTALEAEGKISGQSMAWTRTLMHEADESGAENIKRLAENAVTGLHEGKNLPLLAYYGTGRLWQEPLARLEQDVYVRQVLHELNNPVGTGLAVSGTLHDLIEQFESKAKNGLHPYELENFIKGAKEASKILSRSMRKTALLSVSLRHAIAPEYEEVNTVAADFNSRLQAYRDCMSPQCSADDLLNWLKFEQQLAIQDGRESTQFSVVKQAIQQAIEACTRVEYHLRLGLLIDIADQSRLPFAALSDGQRNMLAMIGDIAYKAAQLNPHLGKEVLQKTPGIVLIDELDLHLHPKWQRHVIEDLRRLFPEIQFIATTHSPFLIQTAREGELIRLDGEVSIDPGAKTLEEIVRLVMDVTDSDRSPRYQAKLDVARAYMALVAESQTATPERRAEIQQELIAKLAPFSDNPAYTALLERKGLIASGE